MSDLNSDKVSNIYEDIARAKISLQGKRYDILRKNALKDPEQFWEQQAKNLIWFKYWDRTLTWDPPFAKWFAGGSLNASVNCIDRHVDSQFKNKEQLFGKEKMRRKRGRLLITNYSKMSISLLMP